MRDATLVPVGSDTIIPKPYVPVEATPTVGYLVLLVNYIAVLLGRVYIRGIASVYFD